MRVQWIAVPALALLVAAPLAAQDEPGLPRAGRIEIERQGMPQRYMSLLMTQRPRLGVTVNLRASDTDSIGALVQSVTPGGPAAKAGIRTGDIITKLDGTVLVSRANRADTGDGEQSPPGLRLVELAARLSPNDTVSVELRRGRDRKTVRLITEGDSGGEFSYVPGRMWKQDSGMTIFRSMPDMKMRMPLELEQQMGPAGQTRMRVFFDSPLGDLELAPLNEDLGSYFGTTDGVLVISVPKDSKLNLKSGDVILSVDGRKPSSPPHLMRILRSYDNGESFRIELMRSHHRETVTGKVE
ncbi:MAG: PDZ domain-containing protein [Bacillota bacterium]